VNRLTAFVTLPLLLAQGPIGGPPAAPSQRIVREVGAAGCGIAPPASMDEWRKMAAAIVRVRLDSQLTYDYEPPTRFNFGVLTAHEATVLDLFKTHPELLAAGRSVTILQNGGTIAREDGLHRYRMNNFDIMPAGSEWVLFLTWHKQVNAFMVAHSVDGAFQMRGGTISTRGWGEFAREWDGKPASGFLALLEPALP
jgi:hypothetical protein